MNFQERCLIVENTFEYCLNFPVFCGKIESFKTTINGGDILQLDSNAHSVFMLWYHLVLVIKYRRKVIDEPISQRARENFEKIAPSYKITLQEWNHDQDHIHILFRAHPKSEISKFIKKEYSEIRRKLWKEYFRSQSFCLLTAGGAPLEVLGKYIESQGERA